MNINCRRSYGPVIFFHSLRYYHARICDASSDDKRLGGHYRSHICQGSLTDDGVVLKCANLGWDIVELKKIMCEKTVLRNIEVANDANVAALGEQWRGSASRPAEYRHILAEVPPFGEQGCLPLNSNQAGAECGGYMRVGSN